MRPTRVAVAAALLACACLQPPPAVPLSVAAPTTHVDLTWLSIANVHFQIGPLAILADGYVTRLPPSAFVDQRLIRSTGPFRPDSAAVACSPRSAGRLVSSSF
jgi:hypothetical protein